MSYRPQHPADFKQGHHYVPASNSFYQVEVLLFHKAQMSKNSDEERSD